MKKKADWLPKHPTCPYCNAQSVLTNGKEIYPRKDLAYLWNKHFYICRPCDAYVGCHPGSKNPLGVLANAEHRKAKMAAHKSFDPIWQKGLMSRSDAYKWLAKEMGIKKYECHIGMFSIADCKRVEEIAQRRTATVAAEVASGIGP